MQSFFLHHAEKLILGLSVILLGLFFWLGLRAKPYTDQTPTELVKLSDTADRYIQAPDAWENLKNYRKGETDTLKIIEESRGDLKPEMFQSHPLSGTVAKTLDRRKDPIILGVTDLYAVQIEAPVLFDTTRPDPFLGLSPVVATAPAGGPTGGNGGRGGPPPGADGGERGGPPAGADGSGRGGPPPGAGAGGRGAPTGGQGAAREDEESDKPEMGTIGSQMQTVHLHTFPGVRPVKSGIPSQTTTSRHSNVVVVTGLIDYKQIWNSYEESFSAGMGYYPDRDKPIFQYLQIERRVTGTEEWIDQSESITHSVPSLHPSMHKLPLAIYDSAPDIVAPENYDPVLTNPIPAFAMVDYLPYVLHPKLGGNRRIFPESKSSDAEEEFDRDDMFNRDPAADNGAGRGRGGAPQFGGRGGAPDMGSRGGGPLGARRNAEQTRAGSSYVDYQKAIDSRNPTSDYRLVRFFDVQTKLGVSYEYRVRVWIGDPNNEDPRMEFVNLQSGNPIGGAFGGGGGRGGSGGPPAGAGGGRGGPPAGAGLGRGRGGPSGGGVASGGEDTEPVLVKSAVSLTMTDPAVRQRLNRAREEGQTTANKKYFVYEITGTDENGEPIYTEIPVPEKRPYLRFARPSAWSETIQITVESSGSQVASGKLLSPRAVRINVGGSNVLFPSGEPKVNVVASVWSSKLGTAVPSQRSVYRGDALDFNAPAHLVHPVSWRIYLTKNDSLALNGEEKYYVPIKTGNVVVDAIGGGELSLPRSEKMRFDMPTEVLIMDASGKFTVHNDLDDSTTYRNLLLLPDESQTVGGEKARKRAERERADERGGAGGPPGGGGGRGAGGGAPGGPGGR